jgi:hypothetical protein
LLAILIMTVIISIILYLWLPFYQVVQFSILGGALVRYETRIDLKNLVINLIPYAFLVSFILIYRSIERKPKSS